MGGRSIEIPRERLIEFLESHGFERENVEGELVYSHTHKRNRFLKVKVYTSIPFSGNATRGCGEDAIRIITYYHNTNNGARLKVASQPKVYRSGSVETVFERMYVRMRAAYNDGTEWLNNPNKPWNKK